MLKTYPWNYMKRDGVRVKLNLPYNIIRPRLQATPGTTSNSLILTQIHILDILGYPFEIIP